MRNQIFTGDALEILKSLPDNTIDSIVTDPPAGIDFMGKDWDGAKGGRAAWIAWLSEIMTEALRVLKPGGHALVWALPRTSHWTTCALEDAGFEIRDKLYHIFASGFPKSYNIAKGIEGILTRGSANWTDWKHLPGERKEGENVAYGMTRTNAEVGNRPRTYVSTGAFELEPTTEEARKRAGYGTALKPAVEEWILCRKPLSESSIAANVLNWGTGGLNIAGCRVGNEPRINPGMSSLGVMHDDDWQPKEIATPAIGRYPSHLLLSHTEECQPGVCVEGCPVLELDEQSGVSKSNASEANPQESHTNTYGWARGGIWKSSVHYGDEGGASRYFTQFYYAPKASTVERNLGCETPNIHPTVKNQQLMRWLCRLITHPGGTVLDCFTGSGSTGVAAIAEGFHFIGVELDPEYAAIAQARLNHAIAEAEREAKREKQIPMFDVPVVKTTPKTAIIARDMWAELEDAV